VLVGRAFLRITVQLHDSIGEELALVRLDTDVSAARGGAERDRQKDDTEPGGA
jgi:hypothetical protein